MSKPWFDQYDAWVPHEIDADAYENVVDMLLEAGETYSDKIAYSNFGATKTYGEILSLSRDFAAYLQTELGVKKGDRVITNGGVHGTIQGIKEKEAILVLQVAKDVKIEVSRGSVSKVLEKKEK